MMSQFLDDLSPMLPMGSSAIVAMFLVCWLGIVFAHRKIRNVSLRYAILIGTLVACWSIPIASSVYRSLGTVLIRVPALASSTTPSILPITRDADSGRFSSRLADNHVDAPIQEDPGAEIVAVITPSTVSVPEQAVAGVWSASMSWPKMSWPTKVWLAGSVMLALSALRSYVWSRRLRASGVVVDCAKLVRAMDRTASAIGLRRVPVLYSSDRVRTPLVSGIRNLILVLPSSMLDQLSGESLEQVLLHELAHVRRRDTLVLLWEAATRIAFWPIVPIHFLLRELDAAREDLCDNEVLRRHDPMVYAKTLLEVGRSAFASSGPKKSSSNALATYMIRSSGTLERRVKSLLDPSRHFEKSVSKRVCFVIAVLMVATATLITGTRLVAMPTPEPQTPGSPPPASQPTTTIPSKDKTSDAEWLNRTEDGVFEFRIVNTAGEPIAGVEVRLWTVSYASSNPKNRFSIGVEADRISGRSNADGRGSIHFPHDLFGKSVDPSDKDPLTAKSIGLVLTHPDYPTWRGHRELADDGEFVLSEPQILEITSALDDGTPLKERLYAMTTSETTWSTREGKLVSGPVDPNGAFLRVIHDRRDGATFFSDLISLDPPENADVSDDKQAGRREISVTLHLGVQLNGELAHAIPRPIAKGNVTAQTVGPLLGKFTNSHRMRWCMSSDVKADGTFELASVPRDSVVEFFARCDGWVSTSPSEAECEEAKQKYPHLPFKPHRDVSPMVKMRLVAVRRESQHVVVPMEATGMLEVTVVDEMGATIPGAMIRAGANFSSSTVTGSLETRFDSLSLIRAHGTPDRNDAKYSVPRPADNITYVATTNEQGIAMMSNLPPTNSAFESKHYISVFKDGYRVQKDPSISAFEQRFCDHKITIRPNQKTRLLVVMTAVEKPANSVGGDSNRLSPQSKLRFPIDVEKAMMQDAIRKPEPIQRGRQSNFRFPLEVEKGMMHDAFNSQKTKR